MRFTLYRARDFYDQPLKEWNGLRVRGVYYITGPTGTFRKILP